jgi:hypothetical protein
MSMYGIECRVCHQEDGHRKGCAENIMWRVVDGHGVVRFGPSPKKHSADFLNLNSGKEFRLQSYSGGEWS